VRRRSGSHGGRERFGQGPAVELGSDLVDLADREAIAAGLADTSPSQLLDISRSQLADTSLSQLADHLARASHPRVDYRRRRTLHLDCPVPESA